MAASRARALLRLERLSLCCSELAAAWRGGLLSWTQADGLARLFTDEASRPWRSGWIRRARAVTVRRLADDVDQAMASGDLDPASLPPLPAALGFTESLPTFSQSLPRFPQNLPRFSQNLKTGARHRDSGRDRFPTERGCLYFSAPAGVARMFRAVLATVQRALGGSEGEALDAMLEHVFVAWGRNRPIPKKYRLFARDGWRCTVSGCTSYRNLQGHHIEFRSRGGSDELSNRTTLCAFHPLRGVHGGTVQPLMSYGAGDLALIR